MFKHLLSIARLCISIDVNTVVIHSITIHSIIHINIIIIIIITIVIIIITIIIITIMKTKNKFEIMKTDRTTHKYVACKRRPAWQARAY